VMAITLLIVRRYYVMNSPIQNRLFKLPRGKPIPLGFSKSPESFINPNPRLERQDLE
jgi:hypothetical protein